MTPPSASGSTGEPDWVETLMPLMVAGLVALVLYTKRAAILGWLTVHHLLIPPHQHPLIPLYSGYGVDLQHIVLLLLPAALVLVTSVKIGVDIAHNMAASKRPR